ncbi:MAG: substrate-binding domain-containing protein [Pirellulaceae bacterium]
MLRLVFPWLLAFAFLPGCSQSSTPAPSTPDTSKSTSPDRSQPSNDSTKGEIRGVIGLSILTTANPFFPEIGRTLKEEAAKHGYQVEMVSGEMDVAKQRDQVKDFLVKKVAAIVLTPCDSRAIGTAIQDANQAGIPVFTADIACIAPEANVVTHIATDNYAGGKQAALAIFEALEGKGKVAILDFPQVESVMLRTKGFYDQLKDLTEKQNAQIEVVASLPGDGAKDKSFKAMQDLLQAHPDLRGVFAINDPSALGACLAIEAAGRQKEVVVVGFDGQPDGRRAIEEGKIYADPVQFPDRIGQETMRTIVRYFDGQEVPKEILIPTELVRQSKTAQP